MNPEQVTLLFAHANGFPAGVYGKFLDATGFTQRVCPERLGHSRFGVRRNWTGITDELLDLANHLPGRVVGVGHSLGAFALYRAALKRPERFSALVLMEPPMLRPSLRARIQLVRLLGLLDRFPPVSLAKKRRRRWPDLPSARQYLLDRPLFARMDPDVFNAYLAHGLEPTGTGEWTLRFRAEIEHEIFWQGPPPVQQNPDRLPLLFLYGKDTDVLQAGDLAHVRKRLNASKAVIDAFAGGHLFPLDQPLEAGLRVGHWLRDLP
jgi:pimeloyl-ACP methyl ester carboxylesterase